MQLHGTLSPTFTTLSLKPWQWSTCIAIWVNFPSVNGPKLTGESNLPLLIKKRVSALRLEHVGLLERSMLTVDPHELRNIIRRQIEIVVELTKLYDLPLVPRYT
jgi:hypothetical protein